MRCNHYLCTVVLFKTFSRILSTKLLFNYALYCFDFLKTTMKRQFTKFALCIKFSFIIICTFGAFKSQAQTTTFRVFFKDKGPVSFEKNNSLYNETLGIFNERALNRRRKVLKEDSLVMLTDAPVYAPYVDSLKNRGAIILLKLRWKNYAVVEVDSLSGIAFKNFSFVEKVQPTREEMTTLSFKNIQDNFLKPDFYHFQRKVFE